MCPPPPAPYLPFRFCFHCKPHISPVVAKLICNSCTPFPPQPDSEKLKREPWAAAVLGLCYWVGVNEKVQNTGEHMPNVFLGASLIVVLFQHFFLQNLSPPLPLIWALLFFLTIGLTQTCVEMNVPSSPPPFPPLHGNFTKAPRGRQGNAKLIVRNKVFECTTLLKIEVIKYGKWVSKWLEKHSQRQRF